MKPKPPLHVTLVIVVALAGCALELERDPLTRIRETAEDGGVPEAPDGSPSAQRPDAGDRRSLIDSGLEPDAPIDTEADAGRDDGNAPDAAMVDGGMATDGDSGAVPDSSTCVEPELTVSTACPPECTGGCPGNVCVIACNQISACQQTALICPNGMPCRIECGGESACGATSISCPAVGACELVCNNTSACQQATFQCASEGACSMTCNGTSTCQNSDVRCGGGSCTAHCAGLSSGGVRVDCAASCRCTSSC